MAHRQTEGSRVRALDPALSEHILREPIAWFDALDAREVARARDVLRTPRWLRRDLPPEPPASMTLEDLLELDWSDIACG